MRSSVLESAPPEEITVEIRSRRISSHAQGDPLLRRRFRLGPATLAEQRLDQVVPADMVMRPEGNQPPGRPFSRACGVPPEVGMGHDRKRGTDPAIAATGRACRRVDGHCPLERGHRAGPLPVLESGLAEEDLAVRVEGIPTDRVSAIATACQMGASRAATAPSISSRSTLAGAGRQALGQLEGPSPPPRRPGYGRPSRHSTRPSRRCCPAPARRSSAGRPRGRRTGSRPESPPRRSHTRQEMQCERRRPPHRGDPDGDPSRGPQWRYPPGSNGRTARTW